MLIVPRLTIHILKNLHEKSISENPISGLLD